MTTTSLQIQAHEHPTFRGVQALRGLAATMVVTLHATQYWSQRAGGLAPSRVWGNGAAGVDIFFVISGFVMAVSTIGREDKLHPARTFLERRLVRIAPLYWIATTVVLLKDVVIFRNPALANAAAHPQTPLSYIVSSFLFIPYRNSLGLVEPILNVGWTLCFEMLFYLLFAAALAMRVRVAVWLTPLMLGLVLTGSLANSSMSPPPRSGHSPVLSCLSSLPVFYSASLSSASAACISHPPAFLASQAWVSCSLFHGFSNRG